MSLPPLVSVNDVTARLPSGLSFDDSRIAMLIKDASAAVRRFAKQDFTLNTSTTDVRPIGYKLRLPQRPVVAIVSVQIKLPGSDTYSSIPSWYWDGSDELWLMDSSTVVNLAEEVIDAFTQQTPVCRITYQHGYSTVPDDIVGVVCSMVTRLITAPGLGGVVSESVGEFSYRLSDAAAQGPMTLTQSEKDVLAAYQPKGSNTIELRG
jgi:hypothetical protein